jgi:uncharacterized protein YndB with AHSA1/START domain
MQAVIKGNLIVSDTTDREIVFTRQLDAPRALVYKAWTTPEQVVQWWGPNGFTNTNYEMDVRPGGKWRYMMHGPDGVDYPNTVIFEEVIPAERLAYAHGDDDGVHFHAVVTFGEMDGKTLLTLRLIFPSKEARDRTVEAAGAVEGGKQTLERLAAHLRTMAA